MADWNELKRLAEAFDDFEWDSNATPFYNDIDGNSRGGECDGTYVVFGPDFEIEGEQYEGATLVNRCRKDEARFICEAKAGILALIAENDRLSSDIRILVRQHMPVQALEGMPGWSEVVEATTAVEQRDAAIAERDQIRAEVEGLRDHLERLRHMVTGDHESKEAFIERVRNVLNEGEQDHG